MRRAPAPAKLNLALTVGPRRDDGRHEVTTVLQKLDLADRIAVRRSARLNVGGFAGDTLVRRAVEDLAKAAGVDPTLAVRIDKRVPVAAGLGGGSSDAAATLALANELLAQPLPQAQLHELARGLGADAPFFLTDGPQLGEDDGSRLTPLDLPQDYWVVLVIPHGARKASTASVYREFDRRCGHEGYEGRRAALLSALAAVRRPRDLAALPANDLATSPVSDELRGLGAFRADVTGAGPVVYGLFHHRRDASRARRALGPRGRTWLTVPAWYG
jgi:4-diphosphocytidyl-2-C-methyl-D-erythritol kinase